MSSVDTGNRNPSPSQADLTDVLSRRELSMKLQSESSLCPPCSNLAIAEARIRAVGLQKGTQKETGFTYSVADRCLGASDGACSSCLHEEGPGLLHAGPSQSSLFQPVQTDPPQGTAEPVDQDGGVSLITCMRQGKTSTWQYEEQGKKSEGNNAADT